MRTIILTNPPSVFLPPSMVSDSLSFVAILNTSSDYQLGERASVRIAAKQTDEPPVLQPAYHMHPYTFWPPGPYHLAQYPVSYAMPVTPAPSAPEKRPAEEQGSVPTKTKKSRPNAAKSKGRGGAGGESKRGYTAKKREAVQTAAQNG